MNRENYLNKISTLLNDATKFEKCKRPNPNSTKDKINRIAKPLKESNASLYKKLFQTGTFSCGHLYGLPKLHKSTTDPPLRPIISMVGTATHNVAKFLNSIIAEYLDSPYSIKSSPELLLKFQELRPSSIREFYSLDVESLFTNVPVQETIEIICNQVYNHETIAPPDLDRSMLNELLTICTTQTPFEFDGSVYIQKNGVSMGSPLGPTFAEFYMANLEKTVFDSSCPHQPKFYTRYVDDTLTIFENADHMKSFMQRLKESSCLNFTCEKPKCDTFQFLDVEFSVDPATS